MEGDVVVAGELDAAQRQHLAAGASHLEHLVEVDVAELAGLRHDARVGGEHAGDIGVDLADVGLQRLGQCRRREVTGPAAHRGDLAVGADPLKAGDDGDLALGERLAHAVAPDLDDLRLAVDRVGDDPDLAAGQADRLDPELGERHRHERRRHPLASREQHVHLSAGLGSRHAVGERDQVVGGLPHGADDHDDVVAVTLGECDMLGDGTDAVGIGDGRAAVLLNDQCHGLDRLSSGSVAHGRIPSRGRESTAVDRQHAHE